MNFIYILILLIFLMLVIYHGEDYPILYLISTILSLVYTAIDFTLPGDDWVNRLLGVITLLGAIAYYSSYIKYRKYNKRKLNRKRM